MSEFRDAYRAQAAKAAAEMPPESWPVGDAIERAALAEVRAWRAWFDLHDGAEFEATCQKVEAFVAVNQARKATDEALGGARTTT